MFTLTIFDNFTLCNPNSSHLQMSHLWTYGLLRCHLWITKFSSSHDEKPLHFNSFLFAKSIFGSQVAGRYRLQGEIGSGSYSEVYLGVDEKTGSRSWKLLWSPRLSLAEAIRLMVKYQYHPISRWPSGNLTLWTCLRKVNQNACTLTFFGFSQRPIGPWAVEIPSHDERRMLDGLKLELSRGPMTDGIWLWRLVWNVPHSSTMGACENDWKWSWSSDHDPKGFGGTLFSDKPWQSYM
jgi:serine/threonine protein kinase